MLIKLYFIIGIVIFFCSCNHTDKPKNHNAPLKVSRASANKSITQKLYLGYWTTKGEENATMQIGTDSVFYTDNFTSYKYTIHQDSIKIHFDGFTGTYFLKMKGRDTLYFTNKEDGESVFYRFSK